MVGSEEIPLFQTLNKHACGLILSLVLGNPGNSQMELSNISGMSHQSISKIMKQLKEVGLMSTISDGSHIRYYPTKFLSDRSEEYYDRSKSYAQFILKKLNPTPLSKLPGDSAGRGNSPRRSMRGGRERGWDGDQDTAK